MKEEHMARCVFVGAMLLGPFPWNVSAEGRIESAGSSNSAKWNEMALKAKASSERLIEGGWMRTVYEETGK